jgi:DNA-binding transcriptional ArsR family regulator
MLIASLITRRRPVRNKRLMTVPNSAALAVDYPPLTDMEKHSADAEAFLRSIASRHRLLVLCQLTDGEVSAGELGRRLGLTQSNLSRHLSTLREEGLVATRREATTIYYRIASDRVRQVLTLLHEMFCQPGC